MQISYSLLKQNGWNAIKEKYWYVFLAEFLNTIIVSAVGGTISSIFSSIISVFAQLTVFGAFATSGYSDSDFGSAVSVIMVTVIYFIIFIFTYALSLALATFIQEPMNVGRSRYFLNNRTSTADLKDIFFSLNSNYKNIAKVSFFRMLYILLWSLLFVIPGIIKSMEYSMVPYILAENPNLDHKTALDLSSRMMNGRKFDYFLFTLSFIGWFILGVMACGLGTYFVTPYYYSSITEFYEFTKADAINSGRISLEALGIV